jgi:OOP family OmpA-OmpF porin
MRLFAALFLSLCLLTPGELCGQGYTYVEGFFGSTSIDALGFSNIDDETAFGLWGGYAVSNNFAIEAGYGNYGDFGDTTIDTGITTVSSTVISTFNIGLKGSVPLDGGFFLHSRVGLALWEIDNEEIVSGGDSTAITLDGEDVYFGCGASYLITETAYISLDYLAVELNEGPGDLDVSVFSLGVGLMF